MTPSTPATLTDGLDLVDFDYYGEHGPPHEQWKLLREQSPVHWCQPGPPAPSQAGHTRPPYPDYWAITRHDEILEISTNPEQFLNEPGIVLTPGGVRDRDEGIGALRTVIEMDPPEHRAYRKVASPFFTPRALQAIQNAIDQSAREIVDGLAGSTGQGECDIANEIATAHPLRVLSTILGVPRSEESVILRLTQQLFAADDPDLRRQGVSHEQAIVEIGAELYALFEEIIADRRANPTDDLASIIANGTVDGESMGPLETFGYCLIAFTAGHDTTKNSLAGGMNAFLDHPDQFRLLRDNQDLLDRAVDEVVRWATPVNYMMRTASSDTELRGQSINEGDKLVLFYASANRDEDLYENPYEFRIDRDRSRHLGFGVGEHYCMGANLAKMTQKSMFRELSTRLVSMDRTDEPEWIQSSFIVGYKHIPVRYEIKT
jgi:cytochrome P450